MPSLVRNQPGNNKIFTLAKTSLFKMELFLQKVSYSHLNLAFPLRHKGSYSFQRVFTLGFNPVPCHLSGSYNLD